MSEVLILNADYQPISLIPLSVVSWQQAIKLHWLGRLHILHSYEDKKIHSPSTTMDMPAVCVTTKYYNVPKEVRFSRENLYIRDTFTCQYCNELFNSSELTIDHVIPRAKGGGTSWENCVASCRPCNNHKGDKLIRPIHTPQLPTYYDLARKKLTKGMHTRHHSWDQYLGKLVAA